MRQRINIAFMAIATVVLLMLAVIPHHHHQGWWCNAVELCVADNDVNDTHTHHSDDHSSCVEKLNYVDVKYSVTKQLTPNVQQLLTSVFTLIAIYESLKQSQAKSSYFISDDVCRNLYLLETQSLRAPPIA
jgi:hypothetical protein